MGNSGSISQKKRSAKIGGIVGDRMAVDEFSERVFQGMREDDELETLATKDIASTNIENELDEG